MYDSTFCSIIRPHLPLDARFTDIHLLLKDSPLTQHLQHSASMLREWEDFCGVWVTTALSKRYSGHCHIRAPRNLEISFARDILSDSDPQQFHDAGQQWVRCSGEFA